MWDETDGNVCSIGTDRAQDSSGSLYRFSVGYLTFTMVIYIKPIDSTDTKRNSSKLINSINAYADRIRIIYDLNMKGYYFMLLYILGVKRNVTLFKKKKNCVSDHYVSKIR